MPTARKRKWKLQFGPAQNFAFRVRHEHLPVQSTHISMWGFNETPNLLQVPSKSPACPLMSVVEWNYSTFWEEPVKARRAAFHASRPGCWRGQRGCERTLPTSLLCPISASFLPVTNQTFAHWGVLTLSILVESGRLTGHRGEYAKDVWWVSLAGPQIASNIEWC